MITETFFRSLSPLFVAQAKAIKIKCKKIEFVTFLSFPSPSRGFAGHVSTLTRICIDIARPHVSCAKLEETKKLLTPDGALIDSANI